MDIPFEISLFHWIYEIGRWICLAVLFSGIAVWMVLLFRKSSKMALLWCLIFPLGLGILNFTVTGCGFHYRMELRNRYGRDQRGNVNISRMPPKIREEYARHNFCPRERDLKAIPLQAVLSVSLLFLLTGTVRMFHALIIYAAGKFRKQV